MTKAPVSGPKERRHTRDSIIDASGGKLLGRRSFRGRRARKEGTTQHGARGRGVGEETHIAPPPPMLAAADGRQVDSPHPRLPRLFSLSRLKKLPFAFCTLPASFTFFG